MGTHTHTHTHTQRGGVRPFDHAAFPVNIWNSLPNHVLCDTVTKFKSRFEKFCQYQDIEYDYTAEIHGSGSQSLHNIGYRYFVSFVFVMRA